MPRRACRAAALLGPAVVAIGLAGCAPRGERAHAATATVDIAAKHFRFSPDLVTVAPGTAVRFVNRDRTLHSVRLQSGHAQALDPGSVWSRRFTAHGIYHFVCRLHPRVMHGVVRVD
jgi:plastocyanin